MKYYRLIYSNFVANRPENASLFEVWCLIGGTICAIFISYDSDTGFMGTPRIESVMSIVFPFSYFYINYLSKYIDWMRISLFFAICLGFMSNIYLFYYPQVQHLPLPQSNFSLMLFSAIGLYLVTGKRRKL